VDKKSHYSITAQPCVGGGNALSTGPEVKSSFIKSGILLNYHQQHIETVVFFLWKIP
jgi:hypothetical protein